MVIFPQVHIIINCSMGALTSKFHYQNSSPQLSYDEIRHTIGHLNFLLKQNEKALCFSLELQLNELNYNQALPNQSVVSGKIVVSGHQEQIFLAIEEILKMFAIMKHSKATPKMTPCQKEEQCCICLNEQPTMMLPCSHSFCDACTIKYIVEMEEKKCPQCRAELKGTKESVFKMIYSVIQEQEDFYSGVREQLLGNLKIRNERVMKKLSKALAQRIKRAHEK